MQVKCPEVTVQLTGQDGNAFFILGKVKREMQRAKVDANIIKEYFDEATNDDYDHLLQTTMRYVNVD